MLQILTISDTIKEWNNKLNSLAGQYMDNAAFGTIVVFLLFLVGCWAIGYLTKK